MDRNSSRDHSLSKKQKLSNCTTHRVPRYDVGAADSELNDEFLMWCI